MKQLFPLFLLLLPLASQPAKADLAEEWRTKQSANFRNAQYIRTEPTWCEYPQETPVYLYVSDNLDVISLYKCPNEEKTVWNSGKINDIYVKTRSVVLFGQYGTCTTKTQWKMEGTDLVKYYKYEGPCGSKDKREIVGTLREGFSFE